MDNLKHLISAYFYEAWEEYEYSSWEQAVDDFLRRSPARAPQIPPEIEALIAEIPDDAALDARLVDLGLSYSPPEGPRAWLLAVRDRIRSSEQQGA